MQFIGDRGFTFRLIRVRDWPTYNGCRWLDGYQLDGRGRAVDRRTIFVRLAGIQLLRPSVARRPDAGRRR